MKKFLSIILNGVSTILGAVVLLLGLSPLMASMTTTAGVTGDISASIKPTVSEFSGDNVFDSFYKTLGENKFPLHENNPLAGLGIAIIIIIGLAILVSLMAVVLSAVKKDCKYLTLLGTLLFVVGAVLIICIPAACKLETTTEVLGQKVTATNTYQLAVGPTFMWILGFVGAGTSLLATLSGLIKDKKPAKKKRK